VLGHGRRQLLWFAVTRHPTAEWLAHQITEAFRWDRAPAYIVRDNDRAFGSVFVLNEEHLRRILGKFSTYYNVWRPHVSLGKDAPNRRPIESFGDIVAHAILGGLHHRYARI